MAISYITEVLSSLHRRETGVAAARETFHRVFRIMCWEFLTDPQRTALTGCVDDVLENLRLGTLDLNTAEATVTGLIEATVRRDAAGFDAICRQVTAIAKAADHENTQET